MKRPGSLRWRIAKSFAATFLLTLAALFFTLHMALDRILLADLDDEQAGFGQALAARITTEGELAPVETVRAAVTDLLRERLARAPLISAVRAPDGTTLAASPVAAAEGLHLRST